MPVQLGSAYGSIRLDASGVQQGVALARAALQQIRGEFGLMAGEVDRQTKTAAASFGAFRQKIDSGANELTGIGTKISLGISAPLLAIGKNMLTAAKDYEAGMSQILALTDATAAEVSGVLSPAVLKLAGEVGKSPQELAQGLYFIRSSGFAGTDALDVLTVSAKASAAGLGDTKTVADFVTSAINAYGKENLTATQATDMLIEAVKQGKGEPSAFAGSLGMVLPVAAQMGVGLDEVTASVATMTKTGLSVPEATTALRGALMSINAPTKESEKALEAMGLSSTKLKQIIREEGLLSAIDLLFKKSKEMAGTTVATGKAHEIANSKVLEHNLALKRLNDDIAKTNAALKLEEDRIALANKEHYWGADVMQQHQNKAQELRNTIDDLNSKVAIETARWSELNSKSQENTETMGDQAEVLDKVFGNVRALTGVLSTSGSQSEGYKDTLNAIKNSTGDVDKAFKVASGTLQFQWNRALATVQAQTIAVMTPVLNAVTPLVQKIGDELPNAVSRIREAWTALSPQMQILIAVFAGVLAVAGPIVLALGGILTVLGALLSPIGLVVIAVGALAAAWFSNLGGIQEKTAAVFNWVAPYVGQAMNFVSGTINNVLGQISLWWTTHGSNVMTIVNYLMAQLMSSITTVLGGIQGFWTTWGGTITTIASAAWNNILAAINFVLTAITLLIDTWAAILNGNWFAVGYNLGLMWQAAWEFIKTILQNAWNAIVAIVNDWGPSVGAAVQNVINGIINTFKNTNWKKLGTDLMEGVKQGIQDKIDSILAMMRGLIASMIGAARSEAKAESPSREMMKLGDDMGEGLGIGWLKRQAWLMNAGQSVVRGMIPQVAMAGGGAGGGGVSNTVNNRSLGGDTFNINVTGENERVLANALIEERIHTRLNAWMGG